MSTKFIWNLDIQVSGGPKITESHSIDLDAYDMIDITVAKGTNSGINVQPNDAGKVQFLLIRLKDNAYDPLISYHLNSEEADAAKRIKLDSLHVLLGEGAIGLHAESPKKIYFYNDTVKDAALQILVGRKALV